MPAFTTSLRGETTGGAGAVGSFGLNRRLTFWEGLWQSPFAIGVLNPNDVRFNQGNFLDDKPLRKKRTEPNTQSKGFGFKKIARSSGLGLRNGDAAQLEAAPRRDADLTDVQRRVQTLAEFLLNSRLCGLRLNIQVHREQKNDRYAKNRTNADQE